MPMRRSPALRPTPWDGLVALAVVLLAAGCLLALGRGVGGEEGNLTAVVTIDGREADRFAPQDLLESPRTYSGGGYTLEVAAAIEGEFSYFDSQKSEGAFGLRVAWAGCPTQDCVRTGAITRSGQSIVCLPARIIIRLEGGVQDGGGPDLVIG